MRLGLKLVVATLSLLLALLAAEAYIRFFHRDLVDSDVLREQLKDNSIAAIVQPTTAPNLYYELKPNVSVRFLASQVMTSPDGYRIDGDHGPANERDNAVRFALLGDSTSFGWGVEYSQTYPELVRGRLEMQLDAPVDLRNYSVPGYNSEQEVAAFLQKVLLHKPDFLIVHHDPNDSEPVGLGFGMSSDFIEPEYGDNMLSSSLLKLAIRQARIRRTQAAFATDQQAAQLVGGYPVSGPQYEAHLKALESLASTAGSLHIPVLAILFNARVAADDRWRQSDVYLALHRRLQDRLENMGILVLDLYPFYQEQLQQQGWKDLTPVWRAPGDAHPNPAGHRLLADAVTTYILRKPELVSRLLGQ